MPMPRTTFPRLHNSLTALVLSACVLATTLLASGPTETAPLRLAATATLDGATLLEASDALHPALPAQSSPLPSLDARPIARRSRHALALPFFSFFPSG
jgi:hypothetical protein